jgi:hypothetical protein
MAVVAFALGGAIGGTVGLLTWLRHHTGSEVTFRSGPVVFYVTALIAIALYIYFAAGWCISFVG